jgi:DNA-binding NtrC family response regulator/tetratricopeptide (TPR) repeat protein
MLQLLADRLVCDRGRWFDLATARPAHLRLFQAGERRQQFEWNDRCAALSRLRHPMLNVLVDYGHAAPHALFEAWSILPPLRAAAVGASYALTHLVRFLRAQAIVLDRELVDCAVRTIEGGGRTARPLGVVLQPRAVVDALVDVLEAGGSGSVAVSVAGPARSGVTTARLTFARFARLAGYVPVAVESARRWPELQSLLSGRHLCIMSSDARVDALAHARWLARLGVESSRRHLHLTFTRSSTERGALHMDPLGIAAMTRMIHVDRDMGPSSQELLAAARVADGWPGQLLAALDAEPFDAPSCGHSSLVHESSVPYLVTPPPDPPIPRPRRLGTALKEADARAAVLAGAGRHAAAVRLLERAVRVFQGRGQCDEAARCALRLGWLLRSRGHTDGAHAAARRGRALSDEPQLQVSASILDGVLWTDSGRFVESEGALRGAHVAGHTLPDPDLAARAALALARALFWQGRLAEALTALSTATAAPSCIIEALALAARVHVAGGDVARALGAASQAVQRAAGQQGRAAAAAHRAMAAGLLLARDLPGARAHAERALHAARAAHLPLTVVRVRALLWRIQRDGNPDPASPPTHGTLSRLASNRNLPHVVRVQIEAACKEERRPETSATPAGPHHASVTADLVALAQRAPDDGAAVTGVLEVVLQRLQGVSAAVLAAPDARVLATCGRPWRERSVAARVALEGGGPLPGGPAAQPPEAAEAVRYAGRILAAIACRWAPGSSIDSAAVPVYLGAASVAVSASLHALLDAPPPPCPSGFGDLLGDSPAALALKEAVQRAARAPFPVLIEGESGSGKELVARAIHRLGPRRDRRFCAINCAAISDELVEAELFGHTRGAFTGAAGERAGLFEEADGGTLFLDEVGELSARAQAKLLRVLQDGEVRRVGENFARRVDVRVVAATNRVLAHEASAGRFRSDLRFRLDVLRIRVPPLRERVGDIPLLAAHFWQDATARVGCRAALGPETLAALARYDWPGNVRELQNAIASVAVHAPRRGKVGVALLPAHLSTAAPLGTGSFEAAREEFERRYVRAALAQTGGHRARAAEALGVSRQGLAKMIKRLGIE